MASEIIVQTIKGPSSGANANTIIVPSGQTLDASAGFNPPPGTIVQVIQTAYTSVDSTTSSSPVDTGCVAYITPRSTSSKILATVNMPIWHASAGTQAFCRISRNNNAAISGLADDFYHPTGSGVSGNITISWLDSPATTSAVKYTAQFGTHTGSSVSLNKDYFSNNNGVTYLTLMEVVQ